MSKHNPPTHLAILAVFFGLACGRTYCQTPQLSSDSIVYRNKNAVALHHDAVDSLIANNLAFVYKRRVFSDRTEVVLWTPEELVEAQKNFVGLPESWLLKPLPSFSLSTLDGKHVTLDDSGKRIVVLNFWFSGCKPCIAEMPELSKLVDHYKNRDVEFIGITFDRSNLTKRFMTKHDFQYLIVPDAKSYIIDHLKLGVFPSHMILKDGVVMYARFGSSDYIFNELSAMIDQVKK